MFATAGRSSKSKSAENTTFDGVQAESIELAKMSALCEQIAQLVQTADGAERALDQRLSGGSDLSYHSCDDGTGGSGSDDESRAKDAGC
jgi:hypothetical protein